MKPSLLVVPLLLLLVSPAPARVVQNDSAAEGQMIGFYPRMQEEEYASVVLDVPDELPVYQVCRVLLWIGPQGFNVFDVRIGTPREGGGEDMLVWQSDQDAFQVFGSRNSMSAIDLRDYVVLSDERRLRVRIRHAPGFGGSPTIAFDGDGITPGRNEISYFTRGGVWERVFTEELDPDDRLYPRPEGDWVIRLDLVGDDEFCPNPDDPIDPDPCAGIPPPTCCLDGVDRDAICDAVQGQCACVCPGGADEGACPDPDPQPDVGVVEPELDMGVDDELDRGPPKDAVPDMEEPEPEIDMAGEPEPEPDMAPEPEPDLDAAPTPSPDLGAFTGDLAVFRIEPGGGSPEENVEVVIVGSGFRSPVRAELGDTRLLEPEVLSSSTITAIVPAGLSPGTYNLAVHRLDDEQTAILPAAYTVDGDLAALRLDSVTPSTVRQGSSAELLFIGDGFSPDTTFRVGGVLLEEAQVESPTTARATLSVPLTAGTYPVSARRGDEEAVLEKGLTIEGATGARASDDCSSIEGRAGLLPALLVVCALGLRRRRRS